MRPRWAISAWYHHDEEQGGRVVESRFHPIDRRIGDLDSGQESFFYRQPTTPHKHFVTQQYSCGPTHMIEIERSHAQGPVTVPQEIVFSSTRHAPPRVERMWVSPTGRLRRARGRTAPMGIKLCVRPSGREGHTNRERGGAARALLLCVCCLFAVLLLLFLLRRRRRRRLRLRRLLRLLLLRLLRDAGWGGGC